VRRVWHGLRGKSRKQWCMGSQRTMSDRKGDTNSQRLRVRRRATQSAQVVVKSDTLQAQALTKVFRAASCATAKAGRSHSSMMGVGPAQGRLLAIFQTLEFSLASPGPRELAFYLSNDPLRLGITESCEMLWD
jgi:hypothetical protein